MPVKIKLPAQLRQLAGGAHEIDVEAAGSVRELLVKLRSEHPQLVERIFEGGELRRFVNIYVGDEDIRFLQGLDTAIEPGGVISILPAVAGGARQTDS